MKKQFYILDIHSVLDVITNSSSEIFIISDETDVDVVEEMLEFMLDQWNKMAVKGVFGKWYVRNERISLQNGIQEHPSLKLMEDVLTVRIMDKHDLRNDGYEWGYEKEDNIGKIIIESVTDNSIPSEMMEWIESAFSSQRWHLG